MYVHVGRSKSKILQPAVSAGMELSKPVVLIRYLRSSWVLSKFNDNAFVSHVPQKPTENRPPAPFRFGCSSYPVCRIRFSKSYTIYEKSKNFETGRQVSTRFACRPASRLDSGSIIRRKLRAEFFIKRSSAVILVFAVKRNRKPHFSTVSRTSFRMLFFRHYYYVPTATDGVMFRDGPKTKKRLWKHTADSSYPTSIVSGQSERESKGHCLRREIGWQDFASKVSFIGRSLDSTNVSIQQRQLFWKIIIKNHAEFINAAVRVFFCCLFWFF